MMFLYYIYNNERKIVTNIVNVNKFLYIVNNFIYQQNHFVEFVDKLC